MIGISIAATQEWEAVIDKLKVDDNKIKNYPYGEYFEYIVNNENLIIYKCTSRKVISAAASQYMIDRFNLKKIVVAGTCAGIDNKYKNLDIFMPNKAVQYDCTVKEIEPLIKERFNVELDLSKYNFEFNTGIIGTADKAVVMWKDYLEIKNNGITIADTESAAIAYVCKANNIECVIIKGISDFPDDETGKDAKESNENQINVFLHNIPIIMNNIFDNYIPKVIG